MNQDPPTIDHNPNEKRPPRWFWWAVFGAVAFLWLLQLRHETDWALVMLSLGTGALLAGWAIDIAGIETPASWRTKPRRKG